MKEPIFKKKSLGHYQVVEKPGTFMVKVANTVKPQSLYVNDGYPRYIVNLRAASKAGLERSLAALGSRDSCKFEDIRDNFIAGSIWQNEIDDTSLLPTKGETVIATYDMVEEVLRCVSITLIPRKTLEIFDLNAFNTSRKLFNDLLKR